MPRASVNKRSTTTSGGTKTTTTTTRRSGTGSGNRSAGWTSSKTKVEKPKVQSTAKPRAQGGRQGGSSNQSVGAALKTGGAQIKQAGSSAMAGLNKASKGGPSKRQTGGRR